MKSKRWVGPACPIVGARRGGPLIRHFVKLMSFRFNTMAAASLDKTSPAARPLLAVQEVELQALFRRALAAHDGVAGAHCIHEWWTRNALPTRIEAALAQLWQHAA